MPIKSDIPAVEVANESLANRFFASLWQFAVKSPTQLAFINGKNESDCVSFQQLFVHAHSVASFLDSINVGYKDVVVVVLPNCWQYAAIFGGTILQGGAISGASPAYTHYELKRQFVDCSCKLVFCADSNLEQVEKAAKSSGTVKTIVVVPNLSSKTKNNNYAQGIITMDKVLQLQPNFVKQRPKIVPQKDLVFLPYSSGTTGPPKGVMISHTNLGTMINILEGYTKHSIEPYLGVQPAGPQHELLVLPMYHVFGFGVTLSNLLQGSTTIFLRNFEERPFLQCIQKYKISKLRIVPPILLLLAKSPVVAEYDLSSVKLVMSGAASAGKELCEEVINRLPHIQLIGQGFGMSELSLASHSLVLTKKNFPASGKLLPNMEAKIVCRISRKELSRGQKGELMIRGPTVMLGYLNKPQATAETIDNEGWLKTGDIGYVDQEGFLYIVDRLKELIKVKGFQVAPAELEDLLLSHPCIRDCAVIGIPDSKAEKFLKHLL
uniref:AMP-dependent synthetase/ligase domain-containing protein n=1 Tax=Ditylenchus dipsaci TaxID=166011 RepID=A0A915DAU6_9BILA